MQAKALLIDVDNLDVTKLGEVFGSEVAAQITQALAAAGLTKVQGSVDAPECDGCDEDEEVDLFDPTFGEIVYENETDERYKTEFNLNGASVENIEVTEGEFGMVEVTASKEGNDFQYTLEYDAEIEPTKTVVVFANGKLTVRAYKVQKGPENVGRSIRIKKSFWEN
jgi:HSP20 family molecular chaperone IbpA